MKTYFEHQKFSKWISSISLGLVIFFGYLLIKTYDTSTFLGMLIAESISVLIFILFLIAKLITQIDKDGITIKFIPFHLRQIKYNWIDIESCEIRKYNPILEFGGWGVRHGFKGKAYNVKGNKGIQLQLKNGNRIMIGTQNPTEAGEVIDSYFKT